MSELPDDLTLGEAAPTEPAAPEPMLVDPRPAVRQSQPKRRRGRPRRDGAQAPIEATIAADTSKPAKRPARTIDVSKAETARQLEGLHQLLAMATDIPDFVITSQEAMMLASPFVDICVAYGIPLDGKGAPFIGLIAAMGLVYGPKIPKIKARLDEKRSAYEVAANAPSASMAQVVDITPAPNGAGNATGTWRHGMTVDANL